MEHQEIVNIGTEHIHPHPDNPRKNLGDLSELTESLKKNGVLQNLTVIPVEGEPGEYYALIGNRRSAAALPAGVTELPCKIIEGMSKKEQVSIMLEENMQRNDLTIYEQAQGFQLMLDLGETEDSISEKTGFSKTTIRHRLNIAKLNQAELQKKEKDDSFQLTLKDLYELEKVKDIKTRNKILKEARDSRDLVWRAQNAAAEEKRSKNAKEIIGILKKMGVEAAPVKAENEMYSGKWETLKDIELDKDVPEKISWKKCKEPVYYIKYYRSIRIIKKAEKKKVTKSEWQIEQDQRDANKKKIKAKLKEMTATRKDFILNIISGKIEPLKDTASLQKMLWQAILEMDSFVSTNKLVTFFLNKDYYKTSKEERETVKPQIEALDMLLQMMIIVHENAKELELAEYNGCFRESHANMLKALYKVLELYGFSFTSEEEEQLLNGTHELYTKLPDAK